MNPALRSEVAGLDKNNAAEAVRKMDVADLLTGMVRRYTLLWEDALTIMAVR